MGFTNPWDETAPLDSQLAKQLGQDIRDLKLDLRQRMMQFGSGLAANKPTPEALFGSATNGVIFFEIDTGKWWVWNGTAWVLYKGLRDFNDKVVANHSNPTVETVLNTVTIPANYLLAGHKVEIQAQCQTGSMATESMTFKLYFGTSVFTFVTSNNSFVVLRGKGFIPNTGFIGFEFSGLDFSGIFAAFATNNAALDLTVPIVVKSTAQISASNPAALAVSYGLSCNCIF